MANKKAIFTCVTGNYDFLFPPQRNTEGWDYICYTDNENYQPGGWQIRHIESTMSKVRTARYVKIMQPDLEDYELTIWMDANFVITCNLDRHVDNNHQPGTYTVMVHPNRKCFYEEAKVVLKKDKEIISDFVVEQLLSYQRQGLPRNNGLIASGIVIRENDERTKKVNELWWDQVKAFSSRDQLAFCHVMWKNNLNGFINWSKYDYLSELDFMYKKHMKNEK